MRLSLFQRTEKRDLKKSDMFVEQVEKGSFGMKSNKSGASVKAVTGIQKGSVRVDRLLAAHAEDRNSAP